MRLRYGPDSKEVDAVWDKVEKFNDEKPDYISYIKVESMKSRLKPKGRNERLLEEAVK
jgi:hypothetical protein